MRIDDGKQTALLVSVPGTIREATMVMLQSIPQIGRIRVASGGLTASEQLQIDTSSLLVIDANLPNDESASLVRWTKKHHPDTKCVVLVRGAVELDQARSAGADAVFLRSRSARQLAEALWPADQESGTKESESQA